MTCYETRRSRLAKSLKVRTYLFGTRIALCSNEMSTIAVKSGGTIDKFIGDAIMVFFGDPETDGEVQDALKCLEMAIMMRNRVEELQKHWKKMGVKNGLGVRMGVSTGFCTVGNFGSRRGGR